MKLKIVFVFLAGFLFFSCTSLNRQNSPKQETSGETDVLGPQYLVYVTNRHKVPLLLPCDMNGSVETYQVMEGSYGNQHFSMLLYFFSDQNEMQLSLLNDFGTDMGSLFYDGREVRFESAMFPKNLKAEYIVCDIQNAYYDSAALEANYKNAGLIFETERILDESGEPVEVRKIFEEKKLIEEITLKNGREVQSITIRNYLRGYEYKLTKVEE